MAVCAASPFGGTCAPTVLNLKATASAGAAVSSTPDSLVVVGGSLQGSGAEGMRSDCKPYSATETGASGSHVEPPVSKRGPSTVDFATEDSGVRAKSWGLTRRSMQL